MLRRSEMQSVSLVSAPMVRRVKLGLEQELHLSREDELCQAERMKVDEKVSGEHPSFQLWHQSLLMRRPVGQFPEVVWTEQITAVLSVQRIVIVFAGTCRNERSSHPDQSQAATATTAELMKDHTLPLVPQRVCFPSWLLSILVPHVSVAHVVHDLQEKNKQPSDPRSKSEVAQPGGALR